MAPFLVYLLFIPGASALIGYGCGKQIANFIKFPTLNVEEWEIPEDVLQK